MALRDIDTDATRTGGTGSQPATRLLPVLIVIGDARNLAANRTVIRIDGSLNIGRQTETDGGACWLLDDDLVSRKHARLEVDERKGWAQIVDMGSRNGTIVDGQPIWGTPARLTSGSIIFIGGYAAVFRFVSEADLAAIEHDLRDPFAPVATASPELAHKNQIMRRLAKGSEDLLLVGETGVGKDVYARAIHHASGRWGKFVGIDCPALPGTLIESELFGYVKGAHSQASRDKLGLIEEAEHGTLFLDEFAEISPEVQAKLLRFFETREFVSLGATKRRQIDVRIIAATNRELGALRQDLAARLGPEPIALPPLRHRPEDIIALAAHFLRAEPDVTIDLLAFQAICLSSWSDNVRGLKKTLERAASLVTGTGGTKVISLSHLPAEVAIGPLSAEAPSTRRLDALQPMRRSPRIPPSKDDLTALLRRHDWVVAHAARAIDCDHAVVWRWIKRYGLTVARQRS